MLKLTLIKKMCIVLRFFKTLNIKEKKLLSSLLTTLSGHGTLNNFSNSFLTALCVCKKYFA